MNVQQNTKRDRLLTIIIAVLISGLLLTTCDEEEKEAKTQYEIERDAESDFISTTQSTVRQYLKDNLKDPKSYESIEWSEIAKKDEFILVRHKYRAKNSFGGYTLENKVFKLTVGGRSVLEYYDY